MYPQYIKLLFTDVINIDFHFKALGVIVGQTDQNSNSTHLRPSLWISNSPLRRECTIRTSPHTSKVCMQPGYTSFSFLICWIIKSRTWPITFKELCANRYTIIQYRGGGDRIRTCNPFPSDGFQDRVTTFVHSSFIICLPLFQWTPFFNSKQRYTIFCSVSNLL